MIARRLTSLPMVLLCALVSALTFASVPALALNTHALSSSFGGSGSGAGQLSSPEGVAVDSVTHDVYVADPGNFRVDEFSSSGAFLRAWGWGVADGLSSFETCTLSCEAGLSGSGAGQFTSPAFVAVDNSGGASAGDIYVGDTGDGLVSKFDSSGNLLSGWGSDGQLDGSTTPAQSFGSLAGIAVDASGSLMVISEGENKPVFKFAQDGSFSGELPTARGTSHGGLAVDATGDVFKINGDESVEELTGSGSDVGQATSSGSAKGIAVDPLTGDLYTDAGDHVEQYVFSGLGEVSEPGGSTCVVKPESGCGATDSFGNGDLTAGAGIGVDPASGNIYVADASTGKVDVFAPAVFPDADTGQASSVQPTTLTLNGTVDPDGTPVTACQFEYGTSTSYGQSAPCEPSPASIGSGTSPVTVSANITGLQPNTEYHYRLLTSNASGTSHGLDVLVSTTGPPKLGSEWVVNVTTTSATFDANVNPRWPTSAEYRLEYGTSTSYGETVSGIVGEGSNDIVMSVHRQDLQPGTTYHYRISVSNVYGSVEGSDQVFATQATSGQALSLPDGRAWELVSPPDKKGALIEPLVGDMQAANDGSGIAYTATGVAVGESPVGKVVTSQVLSLRGSEGWRSQDLTLPHVLEKEAGGTAISEVEPEYWFFSPDLSVSAVKPQVSGTPLLSTEATEQTLYLRDDESGRFTPLVTAANVPAGVKFWSSGKTTAESSNQMHFATVTPDLDHIVFTSPYALTAEARTETALNSSAGRPADGLLKNLYEWVGGRLQLVGILPESEGGEPALGKGSELPTLLAGEEEGEVAERGSSERAISSDGRRIAWTWGHPYEEGEGEISSEYNGLYIRDMVERRTLRVGGPDALFQAMSSDGSRVFFLEDGDLYEFDFDTDTQIDLTAVHGAGESSAGVQQTVLGVDEAGSSVYFVAQGILAAGAVSGEDNLYLSHEGSGGWLTTYIATLSGEDSKSWTSTHTWPAPSRVSARVSSDGRFLTFMSNRSLTGYDNVDASSGERDEEVYLYNAEAQKLACVSCDPTGARPVGVLDHGLSEEETHLLADVTGIWGETGPHRLAGSIPGWSAPTGLGVSFQPRYLSGDGRLFFDSPDALVPQDTNGLEDVYEYEPAGVGDCTSASTTFSDRSDGCVSLISSGTSSTESTFYDASETGDDVFFVTSSRLTAADYDTGNDVYDAHVCSSSVPCVAEPVSSPVCTSGDSCKAAPSPQPAIFGAAPSATFSGVGNVVEEPKKLVKQKAKAKPKPKKHSKKHAKQKKRKRNGRQTRGSRRVRVGRASVKGGK